MALIVAPEPFQAANDAINKRKQIDTFVKTNRDRIRDVYANLGIGQPSDELIGRMAFGTSSEYSEMLLAFEANEWAAEFEKFHGRELIQAGQLDTEGLSSAERLERRKNATFKAVDKIQANFNNDLNQYKNVLDARRAVAAEDDDLVNVFGRQRLIDANLGRGKAQDNIRQFNFLKQLNPVIAQNFNRSATLADVNRIENKFGTVAKFQDFLGAGITAESVLSQIDAADIGDFGVGNLTQEGLQENIFANQGSLSGDLQARIEEARLARAAAFTPGQSQVSTSLTGGQITQDLF